MSEAAVEAMASLVAKRMRAEAHVGELEQAQRAASVALAAAREALAEAERTDAPAAQRRKLEHALADAQGRVAEPWAERIEGARRKARDARDDVGRFAGLNLALLVEAREAVGAEAARRLTRAAEALLEAYAEREAVAMEISQLVALVGRVKPGDVSRTRAEQLATEARRLVEGGGEDRPRLLRDPLAPEHAAAVVEEPILDGPAHVEDADVVRVAGFA